MSREEIREKIMAQIGVELTRVFTSDKFTITRNNETYSIATINPSGQCLKLRFRRDNNVEIDKLDKCGIQGSESIKRVEEALKQIPSIKKINLTDASTISVCGESIKLSCLKILSKGESWYNLLGYYSENSDLDKEANAEIIAKPFHQFLTDCLQKYNEEHTAAEIAEFEKLKTDIETNGSTWFPGTNLTDSTKEYFTKINAIILSDKDKVDCSEETKIKYIWLAAFFDKIIGYKRILSYNESLFKTNKNRLTAGGKKSKKSKKTKKYRKKTKKYRKKTKKRRKITHARLVANV
jgi:hypothetical protein